MRWYVGKEEESLQDTKVISLLPGRSIADKSFLLSKDPEGLSVTLWSDHSFS